MPVSEALQAAQRAHAAGELPQAIAAYEALLAESLPDAIQAAVWYNLASAHRALDHHDAAVSAAQQAVKLADDAVSYSQLGLCLAARGQPERAVRSYERALAGPLDDASAVATWVNLGNARRRAGDRSGAASAYRQALALRPDHAPAHYNLHACVFSSASPAAALAHLDRAPQLPWARALAWAIRERRDPGTAPPEAPSFLIDSLRFVLARPGARWFADTFSTLDFAVSSIECTGAAVELGVRFGTSLRHLAKRLEPRALHGFDSFEGLPQSWGGQAPGLYSTGGRQPSVPAGTTIHPGWFKDTLPAFAASSGPIAFVHVDCDIYASTQTALHALATTLDAGAILVFDDYLGNPTWREDEHAALMEACTRFGWRIRYLAFSPFSRQAVVQLIEVGCSAGAGPE